MKLRLKHGIQVLVLATACVAPLAQAQLFGDDQARQAILDLRERFDQAVIAQNRLVEENANLRRSMLELQSDIEALRRELASARGEREQLTRQVEQMRESLGVGEDGAPIAAAFREPVTVASARMDPGSLAQGTEREQYDASLNAFRSGDFKRAQAGFAAFVTNHPRSALAADALFWLGNAQYATRNYREAISNFEALVETVPTHTRAAESLLSIANCQIELSDQQGARATLQKLETQYPDSEAAQAGRDRLASLR